MKISDRCRKLKLLMLILLITKTFLTGIQVMAKKVKKVSGFVTYINRGLAMIGVKIQSEDTTSRTVIDADSNYTLVMDDLKGTIVNKYLILIS